MVINLLRSRARYVRALVLTSGTCFFFIYLQESGNVTVKPDSERQNKLGLNLESMIW